MDDQDYSKHGSLYKVSNFIIMNHEIWLSFDRPKMDQRTKYKPMSACMEQLKFYALPTYSLIFLVFRGLCKLVKDCISES